MPEGKLWCSVCAYVQQTGPCKLCKRETSPEREQLNLNGLTEFGIQPKLGDNNV